MKVTKPGMIVLAATAAWVIIILLVYMRASTVHLPEGSVLHNELSSGGYVISEEGGHALAEHRNGTTLTVEHGDIIQITVPGYVNGREYVIMYSPPAGTRSLAEVKAMLDTAVEETKEDVDGTSGWRADSQGGLISYIVIETV